MINLTALNTDCIGTFFLNQCNETRIILDMKNHPAIQNWDTFQAHATFFLLYNFFGIPGIILTIFLLVIVFRKIANHRNKGFIFFNVLIHMFLQGFLLSPLLLWTLALGDEKNYENKKLLTN